MFVLSQIKSPPLVGTFILCCMIANMKTKSLWVADKGI